jgi:uncharacterized protein
MKYLILSDIHGAWEGFSRLQRYAGELSGLIICGDLTHFGGAAQAEPVLREARKLSAKIVGVHGNCDRASVAELLLAEGVSVQNRWGNLGNTPVFGLGASLPAPLPTPSTWTEGEAESLLAAAEENIPQIPWIFICHQPPRESEADIVRSGAHVGSFSVAGFIRRSLPTLVCTGHIHESFSVSQFADSLLVNPGSFKEGRFALAELNDGGATAELLRL